MSLARSVAPARLAVPFALAAWGKAVEWLTLAAMLTLLPRVLGPADYGIFGLGLGLVTIGSVAFALGGPSVMARFLGAAAPNERPALARALALRAILWRALGLALLVGVAMALMALAPGRFPAVPTLIVLGALVLDSAATLVFQLALGFDRSGLWSFRYPLQNAILVAAVPLLYARAGTAGALGAIALSSGAALLLGLLAIRGHLAGPVSPVPPEASRFAVLQTLNGLLIQLVHRGGIIAVAAFAASSVQTGYAAFAVGVALAFTYAIWQLFTVALPSLALMAADDVRSATSLLTRLAGRLILLLLPASIAGALLVRPMLELIAGSRFAPARDAVVAALAIVPLAPLTGAVGAAAAIELRAGARLWTTALGAAVFIPTAIVLVPDFGALGASAALFAGTMISALAGAFAFRDLLSWKLIAAAVSVSVLVLLSGLAS